MTLRTKIGLIALVLCLLGFVCVLSYFGLYKDFEFTHGACDSTRSWSDSVQSAKWDEDGNLIVTVVSANNCAASSLSGDYRLTLNGIYFKVFGHFKSDVRAGCFCPSLGHFKIRNLIRKNYKLAMEGNVPSFMLKPDNTIITRRPIDQELVEAVKNGFLKKVTFLKSHGAKIDTQLEATIALEKGSSELKEFLKERENDASGQLELLLLSAAKKADMRSIQALVEKGADINIKDANGRTPLMLSILNAFGYNPYEIVKFLIEKGADVNTQDNRGRNAVLYAMAYGDVAPVQFLINKGADVTVVDKTGMTARDIARKESKSKWRYKTLVLVLPILEKACQKGNRTICKSISSESIPTKTKGRTVYKKLDSLDNHKYVNAYCSKETGEDEVKCSKHACENKKHLPSCHSMGSFYKYEGNLYEARKYYRMACMGGYWDGCSSLALVEERKGNIKEAIRLLKDLCARGREGDCNMLKHKESLAN